MVQPSHLRLLYKAFLTIPPKASLGLELWDMAVVLKISCSHETDAVLSSLALSALGTAKPAEEGGVKSKQGSKAQRMLNIFIKSILFT